MNQSDSIDLLAETVHGGCACKLPLAKLNTILRSLDGNPAIAGSEHEYDIGLKSRDDVLFFQAGDSTLASSLDFGTPVSSDAETWGRIAAVNALSDLYASGARPVSALAILGWPRHLPLEVSARVLEGASSALFDAGLVLGGGHSIESAEPLFGLSVTGVVKAGKEMKISNAKPGDKLILTKPLGFGLIVGAQKAGVAGIGDVEECEAWMSGSNRLAASIAVIHGISAATDISGYGFAGHLLHMMTASGTAALISASAVPALEPALVAMTRDGIIPNSTETNYFYFEHRLEWGDTAWDRRFLICDPQTSGGLLLAVPETDVNALLETCRLKKQFARVVGQVIPERLGRPAVQFTT